MENFSRPITAKFALAAELLEAAIEVLPNISGLRFELEAVRTRYALCTTHLFFQVALEEIGRIPARDAYQQIIAAEGFVRDLDLIIRRIEIELGIANTDPAGPPACRGRGKPRLSQQMAQRIKSLLEQYSNNEIDCAARVVEASCITHGGQYNVCSECQVEMHVSSETSELACASCGKVRELVGTVFDDSQFYNQEGQKAKSGSFNPNRHFHFWMDRILAREPEDELGDRDDPDNIYGEKLLDQLRAIVRRDKKILRLLTVDDVRGILKEIGRTDLNKNVPLLLRRLTGIGPPQLPESVCQRVEKLFSKAIEVGERTRMAGRTNRNYYPYYIYKILDAVLPCATPGPEGAEAREHRRVLYYIYMQGQDTLDKNDREWKHVCSELPEIEWVSTNRAAAQKYRPTM